MQLSSMSTTFTLKCSVHRISTGGFHQKRKNGLQMCSLFPAISMYYYTTLYMALTVEHQVQYRERSEEMVR